MADATYQPKVYRVQGGDRQVIASGGSCDVESGGEIDIESGGSLKLAGTAITSTAAELNIVDGVTSTAAELNLVDGSVAGTAVASKALVLGADKNVDTLAIANSGLKLGAGAGTAVTSTAAELNILDGVTSTAAELNILDGVTATAAELNLIDGSIAGTAVASKALALGADKNVDVLAVLDLKLGAAAGTSVTATADEINSAAAAAGLAANGLGRMGVARFTYDPSTTAGDRTVAAHGTGVTLPINAVVIGGFFETNTAFTSDNANNGTIAISVEGANDIQTAAAVSGAPYSTIGRKAIVPKSNTPESTSVKCTAAREITCTVAVSALLTGKLTGFLHYVVSAASA